MHGNSEPGIFVFGRKIISFPLFFFLAWFSWSDLYFRPDKILECDVLQRRALENLQLLLLTNSSHAPGAEPLGASDRLRKRLVLHTGVFQHIRPLPACASVAVFQMLSEMISPEELFRVIALSKFVHFLQMSYPDFPILISCYSDGRARHRRGRYARAREVLATISARVGLVWPCRRVMKGSIG